MPDIPTLIVAILIIAVAIFLYHTFIRPEKK
jgi:uncharacterized membrane protein YqiK